MSLKQFTLKEVSEHHTISSLWLAIDNKVYDVTKFVTEHPGGCEVLSEQAGKDASEIFADVGHSTDARAMKEEYLIGEIVEAERKEYSKAQKHQQKSDMEHKGISHPSDAFVTPALIATAIALLYYLLFAN